MWKVGEKYKCIKTDSYKCFTEGKYYELYNITPFAKAYYSPLYWFYDNKNNSKFIVKTLIGDMFQSRRKERKEKLNKINEI